MVLEQLAGAACVAAEKIHDDPRQGIIISGGSNQLSRALLTTAWHAKFSGEPLPQLYIFPQAINYLMYKAEDPEDFEGKKIFEWIKRQRPGLAEKQRQPLWFLDDFTLTGFKCESMSRKFHELGYANLRFLVFAKPEHGKVPRFIEAGIKSTPVVRELYRISLMIQGQPHIDNLLEDSGYVPYQMRLGALATLREISHLIANRR